MSGVGEETRAEWRERRFLAVLDRHHVAHDADCAVEARGALLDHVDGCVVLVEDNANGGAPPEWVTVHRTGADALAYHDDQEWPGDWTVEALYDLDTGDQLEVERRYVEAARSPAGLDPTPEWQRPALADHVLDGLRPRFA